MFNDAVKSIGCVLLSVRKLPFAARFLLFICLSFVTGYVLGILDLTNVWLEQFLTSFISVVFLHWLVFFRQTS